MRYTFATFSSTFFKGLNRDIDKLSIGLFLSPTYLGLYGLVKQFSSPLLYVSAPFSINLFPQFVKNNSQALFKKTLKNIGYINKRIKIISFIFSVILVSCLVFYLGKINSNLDLQLSLTILFTFLGAIIAAIMWWCRPFSSAVDPNISLRTNFYALLATIFFLVPLIYFFSLPGAAIGSFIINLFLYKYFQNKLLEYGNNE